MNHVELFSELTRAMSRRKELEHKIQSAPHVYTDEDLAQGVRFLAAVKTYNRAVEDILDGVEDPNP